MLYYNIGYRYSNGEVEGFSATGFNEETAKGRAMDKLINKIGIIQETRPEQPDFDEECLLKGKDDVSQDEMKILLSDWKLSRKSNI